MKKSLLRFAALLLLLLSTLSAVSCAGGEVEAPDGMQLCSADELEYYFFVPTSWVVNTASGSTSAYYSLENDRASVLVTSYAPEKELNVEGYWDTCEEEYKLTFKNYSCEEPKATTVSDMNALEYVFTADLAGVTYKYSQTIFSYGGRFYTITYTATPENFDTHLDALASMKAEFKFR